MSAEVTPQLAGKLKFDGNLFDLNPLRLAETCDGHAKLYWDAAERLSAMKYQAELLEADISFRKSDIAFRVYKNPLDFDLDRASEDKVKIILGTHTGLIEMNKRLMLMHYQIDQMSKFLSAMDHRKRMLELKVELQGQGYYAEPRTTPKSASPPPQRASAKAPRQPLS